MEIFSERYRHGDFIGDPLAHTIGELLSMAEGVNEDEGHRI